MPMPERPLTALPAGFLFVLLTLALAACTDIAPTPTPPPDSGVRGQVLIGPMCPVVREGTPCPDQPFQATVAVVDEAGVTLTAFRSGEDGRFRVALPPGRYTLVPQPDGIRHAPEVRVEVPPGEFVEVTVTYDSGIR